MRDALGVDIRRAIEALELLASTGVLQRLDSAKRGRRYEAVGLFELVTMFKQDVATGRVLDSTFGSLPDLVIPSRDE